VVLDDAFPANQSRAVLTKNQPFSGVGSRATGVTLPAESTRLCVGSKSPRSGGRVSSSLRFLRGLHLRQYFRWVSWIDITSRDLVTFGTGKGERLSVNSSGVRSDDEGFAGHGRLGGISFNNIH
jgi:hypothetical protein